MSSKRPDRGFPRVWRSELRRPVLRDSRGGWKRRLGLLDQAKEQLGDRVDLRLERARLWASKNGPQVLKA